MKTVLFTSAFLAATALAAPHSRRKTPLGQTVPAIKLDRAGANNDTAGTDYSSNWAGAVYTSPPSGTSFDAISASWNVPTPSNPGSGSGPWYGCAWVGIDGDTYGGAILQAGIDWEVDSSGDLSYSGWYEWYPQAQINFDGFSMNAGDTVSVSIVANSNSQGTVVIENQTSGQQSSVTVDAPNSSATLEGQNAEWIVEDFSSGGGLVPFANFGTVTFNGCSATASGQNVDASGADTILLENSSGQVITSVNIDGSSVQVSYQ